MQGVGRGKGRGETYLLRLWTVILVVVVWKWDLVVVVVGLVMDGKALGMGARAVESFVSSVRLKAEDARLEDGSGRLGWMEGIYRVLD